MLLRTGPEHSQPLYLSEESYTALTMTLVPARISTQWSLPSPAQVPSACTHLSPHQRAGQTQQKVERQRLKQAGDHREPCRTGPTAELGDPKEPPLGRTLPDRDRRPQNR